MIKLVNLKSPCPSTLVMNMNFASTKIQEGWQLLKINFVICNFICPFLFRVFITHFSSLWKLLSIHLSSTLSYFLTMKFIFYYLPLPFILYLYHFVYFLKFVLLTSSIFSNYYHLKLCIFNFFVVTQWGMHLKIPKFALKIKFFEFWAINHYCGQHLIF